jgi:hypothetical protein
MGRPRKNPLPEHVDPNTNEQWYMYLVNYWVPFPSSEYGGLQCVLARNKEEAKAAIKEAAGEFMVDSFKDADERIEMRINKAEVFPVIGSYGDSHVVRSFET